MRRAFASGFSWKKLVILSTFCIGTVGAETGLAIICRSGPWCRDTRQQKSFQHLFTESVAELTPILRCDDQAVLAMLEKPSWGTRHISMRGEALRQAKEEREVLITYVSAQNQVADPLTKPTSPQLNKGFYPKWGLVPMNPTSGRVSDNERQRPGLVPVSKEKKNKWLLHSMDASHSLPQLAQGTPIPE